MTRFERATNSLEGCDSTVELHPRGGGSFEPPFKFTHSWGEVNSSLGQFFLFVENDGLFPNTSQSYLRNFVSSVRVEP